MFVASINTHDGIKFEVTEITEVGESSLGIELRYPYFVSSNNSTRFMTSSYMDRELKISDKLICFYSRSKEACTDWVTKKKDEMFNYHERMYSLLKDAVVEFNIEKEI